MIQSSLPFRGSWPWLPHCFSTPPAWALPHIDFRQPVTSPATSRLVKVFDYTLRSQSLFTPWGTLPNSKGTRYCCQCGMIPTWRLYLLSPLLGAKSMNKICSSTTSPNSIPKFTINCTNPLFLKVVVEFLFLFPTKKSLAIEMAIGLLESKKNPHPPGTVLLADNASGSENTEAVISQRLKHGTGRNAHIVLVPQPSYDPNDPFVRTLFC